MKNNESGFTYPLTLCLLIIFLLFLSSRIEVFLSERKIAHETNTIMLEEYYFLSSVKKIESIYQKTGILPAKGTLPYVKGNIDYQTETPIGYIQKVNFTLHLNTDGITVNGRGYFDTRTKRLSKWLELK
ncbi:ComGG family competence protein [Neobacillus sp. MER 74]|uniref:competence type IV pilus minor pilin ComGG n=1 Tax=Neobacillus sp. MER 74 TaxID=2939566 RepID=UPI00203A5A93|nr:competence type IV pilus minor pilin ComGG [Neobacillus sp. MER 74]MCM3114814.1 ComGG family competence protein [Neobacillus sp. MER 74]